MADFLLELRSEEIPARMQAGARAELEKLFRREMEAAEVGIGEITVWSTPRRLALIARNLPEISGATRVELKGPPVGSPSSAIDGFCRKNNIRREDLEVHQVKGRDTYLWIKETEGRLTKDVLTIAIRWIVEEFSWPKSMRWGAASLSTESLRWVRPLSGIVALLGDEVVPCEVHGVTSGAQTMGHRFHHHGPITIGNAGDYAMKLRAGHVIVDHEERAALIRESAAKAAADAGLTLVAVEGLVVENAGLTEWPVPLLGRFDAAYLDVPPEVIQLTARVNQKYFVCKDSASNLANAFICTANIAAEDGGAAIVDGNRKVLAARLSDARFFWEQDRKTALADHAKKLERITFHEKLGTVADKVERVAKLARWLVEEGIVKPCAPSTTTNPAHPEPVEGHAATPATGASTSSARAELADMAEQAARLCKADLVTEMVGEFPELQGLMGGYYARAEGLPDAVADAIRDHYKPVGQGDDVPTAPVTVAVSLADKLDTLVGFFGINEKPTGSKDPFALRRAAIALINVSLANHLRFSLADLFFESRSVILGLEYEQIVENLWPLILQGQIEARQSVAEINALKAGDAVHISGIWRELELLENKQEITELQAREVASSYAARQMQVGLQEWSTLFPEFSEFLADRLKVQQREAGVRHDLIDAVFALGGEDDLVRLLARVKALQGFMGSEDGANLLAGYKRAANILKKEGWTASTPHFQASERSAEGAGGEGPLDSQGIARTGEEDPLAMVDDPDMVAVVKAQLEERKNNSLSYAPEPAEGALIAALDRAGPEASAAVEAEDFAAAMRALATLRAPIDRFFEEVTVNDPDRDKRTARLDLLLRFRDAVHRVADFSRIEG